MRAQYLRSLRERRGWTQADLAQKADVPQSTVSRLERGQVPHVSHDVVVALARLLEVDVLALRFGPDPNPPKLVPRPRARQRRLRRRTDDELAPVVLP